MPEFPPRDLQPNEGPSDLTEIVGRKYTKELAVTERIHLANNIRQHFDRLNRMLFNHGYWGYFHTYADGDECRLFVSTGNRNILKGRKAIVINRERPATPHDDPPSIDDRVLECSIVVLPDKGYSFHLSWENLVIPQHNPPWQTPLQSVRIYQNEASVGLYGFNRSAKRVNFPKSKRPDDIARQSMDYWPVNEALQLCNDQSFEEDVRSFSFN